jgi:hypothetical protein
MTPTNQPSARRKQARRGKKDSMPDVNKATVWQSHLQRDTPLIVGRTFRNILKDK